MSQGIHSAVYCASARSGWSIAGTLVALLDRVGIWIERSRQRRTLEALPDHLLSDIGISRSEAASEADKPFWRC
jgi:uncharacterized protein YjiS (DUF1127 family)